MKLSSAMERALKELKRIDAHSKSADFPHKDEPNMVAGWRVFIGDAKYPTLDALHRRGLAEFCYGKLYKDSEHFVPLYRLAQADPATTLAKRMEKIQ